MRKGLFFRLAVNNIKRNKGTYIPYMLTCMCCIAMMYMMFFITQSKDLVSAVPDIMMVTSIMWLGIIVIYIFSFIFLLYSNSFVMKRRQREIGLYNVLGMEKGHIMKMMAVETILTSCMSISGGIVMGILGSKLALLLLMKVLHVPAQLGFYICVPGILISIAMFLPVMGITLIRNVHRVRLNQPAELLRSGSTGEREPKAKWIMAFLGFICLGTGYYLAVTTKSPLQAIGIFFLAVILVMAGTYLLFTVGSIAVLKMLRWKKSFYYKTKNFISISGMMYRMKQNAMGLASICILSTGVLLMLSTTVSLNIGVEDSMRARYPYDVNCSFHGMAYEEIPRLREMAEKAVEEEGIPLVKAASRAVLELGVAVDGKHMEILTRNTPMSSNVEYLILLPEEEYDRITKRKADLKKGEVLAFRKKSETGNLTLNDKEYRVKEWLKESPVSDRAINVFNDTVLVVDPEDLAEIDSLQKELAESEDYYSRFQLELGFDIQGEKTEKLRYGEQIQKKLETLIETTKGDGSRIQTWMRMDIREKNYRSFYSINGGLLFLGIFLGVLFLVGAGMIIYYKQMSEGYEDKERFEIMQKVGMSRREVKDAIRKQILMVFFLPLLMSILHIIMAFPMMSRLLSMLGLMNTSLFMTCTAGTIVIFALIYTGIYMCTAKSYYKVVERR